AKPAPKKSAPAAAKNGKKAYSSFEDSSDDDSDYEEEVKVAPTKQPAADAAPKVCILECVNGYGCGLCITHLHN
ncbi:hypothetical protein Tco_1021498, partial [Tanacetum coccineum]